MGGMAARRIGYGMNGRQDELRSRRMKENRGGKLRKTWGRGKAGKSGGKCGVEG